jgi:hypothetical protein
MLFAWMFSITAGLVGSTMIAVALAEALPSIIRSTMQRTMKRRRV